MMYLEDIVVGTIRQFGRYEVTEDEIIGFAKTYDDQSFHTDVEAARGSIYGGLIASGWHVCAMFMRMACDAQEGQNRMASLGSPGFDDLKWLVPVRPGDVLSARTEVIGASPSRSKRDRGTVSAKIQVLNQTGAVVLEMTSMGRFFRRPAEAET